MPAVLVLACALFGASAGALVPRSAYRLAVAKGTRPRAGCGGCGTPFPPGPAGWANVRSRCPSCGAGQGPPAWLTAPAGALACGVAAWVVGSPEPAGWRAAVATCLVLAAYLAAGVAGVLLAAIDLACLRLPDLIVGATSGTVLLLLGSAAAVSGTAAAAQDLLRALAAGLLLSGGYLVLALVPGASMGLGDVKLCALLGLLLGWLSWGAVLLGAALPHLINGPVALALLLTGRAGRRTALPLGPALLAGALLAIAGDALLG